MVIYLKGGHRMLVSADTDSKWLTLFKNMTNSNHQILLVPVYEDGVTCGDAYYPAERRDPPSHEEMEFAGDIKKKLTTNREIFC